MMRVLGEMGAKVDFVVPDRFKYGYGLTPEIVQLGIDEFNPDVIVTVDNGISSHEGVDKARENGITVIITDHHLTTKPNPAAQAVVNPNQLQCEFDSKAFGRGWGSSLSIRSFVEISTRSRPLKCPG